MDPFARAAWLAPMLLAAGLAAAPRLAFAQPPEIKVELNKLEQVEGACRAYLVFANGTESAFTALKLDLVLFGQDGVIAKRLAVDGAPLPAGKTSVKLFDIADLACGAIGRVLLNDVMACEDATGAHPDCLALVQPASRTLAPFVK